MLLKTWIFKLCENPQNSKLWEHQFYKFKCKFKFKMLKQENVFKVCHLKSEYPVSLYVCKSQCCVL